MCLQSTQHREYNMASPTFLRSIGRLKGSGGEVRTVVALLVVKSRGYTGRWRIM